MAAPTVNADHYSAMQCQGNICYQIWQRTTCTICGFRRTIQRYNRSFASNQPAAPQLGFDSGWLFVLWEAVKDKWYANYLETTHDLKHETEVANRMGYWKGHHGRHNNENAEPLRNIYFFAIRFRVVVEIVIFAAAEDLRPKSGLV